MKLRRRKTVERRRAAKDKKKKRRHRRAGGREGIWERAMPRTPPSPSAGTSGISRGLAALGAAPMPLRSTAVPATAGHGLYMAVQSLKWGWSKLGLF